MDSSFCDEYIALADGEEVGVEQSVILSICNANLADNEGAFISVESKMMPVPTRHVFDADQEKFRLSIIPADNLLPPAWPYGYIYVGSMGQSLQTVQMQRTESSQLPEPVGSSMCDFELSLHRYSIYHASDSNSLWTHAHEMRLSDSVVVVFGGSPDLLRAMADAFVRINCVE